MCMFFTERIIWKQKIWFKLDLKGNTIQNQVSRTNKSHDHSVYN